MPSKTTDTLRNEIGSKLLTPNRIAWIKRIAPTAATNPTDPKAPGGCCREGSASRHAVSPLRAPCEFPFHASAAPPHSSPCRRCRPKPATARTRPGSLQNNAESRANTNCGLDVSMSSSVSEYTTRFGSRERTAPVIALSTILGSPAVRAFRDVITTVAHALTAYVFFRTESGRQPHECQQPKFLQREMDHL